MKTLEIPEQLKGPWDHVLILTYGLGIPFFERSLWQQFSSRCRNKIILADGRYYLQACAAYAQQKGLVRSMNQSYIVAGIFSPHATHAKLILLTNPKQGRLLVGSGNLNWQGYASGGEMFTVYEYSEDSPEALTAFLAVREMIDELIRRHPIEAAAQRRIRYMWEQTRWLFSASTGAEWPVRHNIARSFLDQLAEAVGGESVEELWVLAPFYDKETSALERLVDILHPHKTTLLMQPGHTSVDPFVLREALAGMQSHCEVRPFQLDSDIYVHAKCYLLKLADRAICLQGSPNLSHVAMVLTDPHGNVEVGNLLTGSRNAFDYLLEALHIDSPVTDFSILQLSYRTPEESDDAPDELWRLTGGEWYKNRLLLSFQGTLPHLQDAVLVIADTVLPLTVLKVEPRMLELVLPTEAANFLGQPLPLSIRWTTGEATQQTNAIFVCNRAALDAALQYSAENELLDHAGDLDLEDKEIEELLGALNETLVIDRQSVWQLAGRTISPHPQNDETVLHLDYADIDYDGLRQHPKIQQYLRSAISGQGYMRSRLQIILNAITAHFQEMVAGPPVTAFMYTISADLEESEEASTEEVTEAVEERQKRHWTAQQRIERLLKNFIQRYLQGLRSPDFQAFVGGEVITKNYIIFTHLLWRLFAKNWVEPAFILDALSETWSFFWGTEVQPGYFYSLPLDEQIQALQQLEDCSTDAVLFAAFYYSAKLATHACWEKRLFTLRNCWRAFVCRTPFPLLKPLLATAQRLLSQLLPYDPPSSMEIVDQLSRLAQFETRASFLQRLETAGRYPTDSFTFVKEDIWRNSLGRKVSVDCLLARAPEALTEKDDAVALLQEWMLAERLD